MYLKDYINSYLKSHALADKFSPARLASVGIHDKYIQDKSWSSLLIAFRYAGIMLPALIDLCWQNVPVPSKLHPCI